MITLQGVTYYQLNSSTANIPATAGATADFIDGFYGVDGTLEYLIWRINLVVGGTVNQTTDVSSLISKFKLVVDGEILYDWVCGIAPDNDSAHAGRFGYFINQIGGRALQVPMAANATSTDMFIAIPVGAVLSGTPRF